MKIHAAIAAIDPIWAIEPNWAAKALVALEALEADGSYDFEARRSKASDDEKPFEMYGSTAIIPITGVLSKQQTSAQWLFGGTSAVACRRMLRQAVSDPDVKAIALFVDSPGGSISGIEELASEIRSASSQKPCAAFIEDLGCSAAYWLASQATKIYSNKPALIGSIGCMTTMVDSSEMAKKAGIKVHVIGTSKLKGQATPGTPVSKEAIDETQKMVNTFGQYFFDAVATGRNFTAEQLTKVTTAQVWVASEAKELGLIDSIVAEFGDVLNELQSGQIRPRIAATAGEPMEEPMKDNKLMAALATLAAAVGINISGKSDDELEDVEAEDQKKLIATAGELKEAKFEANDDAQRALQAAASTIATGNAKQFVADLLAESRIVSSESEELEAAYLTMVKTDGGGKFQLDANGALVTGEATKAFVATTSKRPRHGLFAEKIETPKLDGSTMTEADREYAGTLPNGFKAEAKE